MNYLILYPLLAFLIGRKFFAKDHLLFLSILSLIFFSGLSAIYIYKFDNNYSWRPICFEAVVFHCATMAILVYPFKNFDMIKKTEICHISDDVVHLLTLILIVCGVIAYSELLPQVDMRTILFESQYLRGLYDENSGMNSYFTFISSKYWTVSLVLSFYYVIKYPRKKVYALLLFLASLTYILEGIRFAGRECILKYSFVFVSLYYLLQEKFNERTKKNMKLIIVFLLSLVLVIFTLITIARFSQENVIGQQSDTSASLLSYFGQGFVNFSSVYLKIPDGLYDSGSARFPFFFGAAKGEHAVNLGFDLTTFSTTIGSWVQDRSIVGAFLLSLIYGGLFTLFGKIKLTLFTIIYVAWAYEFIFSSIFFYNDTMNGSRVISLFFIILLDVITRKAAYIDTHK